MHQTTFFRKHQKASSSSPTPRSSPSPSVYIKPQQGILSFVAHALTFSYRFPSNNNSPSLSLSLCLVYARATYWTCLCTHWNRTYFIVSFFTFFSYWSIKEWLLNKGEERASPHTLMLEYLGTEGVFIKPNELGIIKLLCITINLNI